MCKILQRDVIIDKDATLAHRNLLRLPGIANYLRNLRTQDEKEHFERHLRKYINMYLPECPFEVCTTNRYTILTHEACVVARRPIKQGESIRFLSGIQVEMTEKEEEELSSRTDFSIVISSRRKRPSLFLGPARFANHDCDSNARLSTSGPHGIHIVARKSIAVGEEITVQYGDNYFGEDNCECLCASCEKAVRNGWDPRGPILHESDSDSDGESETEEGDSSSRWPPPRANKKSTSTPASLKRKRGVKEEPQESESPKKRGRAAVKKSAVTGKFTKASAAGKESRKSTTVSQEMMAEWFAKRFNGEPTKEEANEEASDDFQNQLPDVESTLPEKQGGFEQMMGILTAAASRKINKLDAEIAKMNAESAYLMQIDVADLPRRCDQKAPQNQPAIKTEDYDSQDALGGASAYDPMDVDESAGDLTESPTIDVTGWFTHSATESPERFIKNRDKLSPNKQKKGRSSKVTDKFAQSKLLRTPLKQERSHSNLRNVLNADDDAASDIFEIPESPPPADPPKRSRGRPRKYPRKAAPREESSHLVETTHNSTDSSSMSSIFSTEGLAGEASSLSSTDQSPNRLDGFSAGNICQNIVEMYTTEPSPEETNWEEERKMSTERLQDWSRGRLPVRKSSRRALAITSIENPPSRAGASRSASASSTQTKRGEPRTPGDYHLTTTLLATPYHRWVECRNCDEFFVQAEAYLTRIACPRCERHSKLYGYYWPKTDREGRWDNEERVLDHRTIHRFIDAEDERLERKGKRGLAEVIRERETSSRASEGRGERLRGSPAGGAGGGGGGDGRRRSARRSMM